MSVTIENTSIFSLGSGETGDIIKQECNKTANCRLLLPVKGAKKTDNLKPYIRLWQRQDILGKGNRESGVC